MEPVTVRQCCAYELEQAPEFGALVDEYALEACRADLGAIGVQVDQYKLLESHGLMRFLSAWRGQELVGFATVVATIAPHYGKKVATTETLFLSESARDGGAGLDLLKLAEQTASEMGAVGFFVSAPVGGALSKILPRVGFKHTNEVFFKAAA
jgi:N-acetylglutamate synthase-like GNAT family acetyltransferase